MKNKWLDHTVLNDDSVTFILIDQGSQIWGCVVQGPTYDSRHFQPVTILVYLFNL